MLYLIEILHQTTTSASSGPRHRVLYLIEILHQTTTTQTTELYEPRLYLIEILHQTTTAKTILIPTNRCILSKFYIKPQLVRNYYGYSQVVSYRNSTSNHNYTHSRNRTVSLYLIEILHQTTTCPQLLWLFAGCILSKFYIKPQQKALKGMRFLVVSYRNSTSNHNSSTYNNTRRSVVSYRNSTSNHNKHV